MTTAADVARHIRFDKSEPNLVSYSIIDHANGDKWEEIKVIFNGRDNDAETRIPKGEWMVVCRDGELDHTGLKDSGNNPITVKGGKIMVHHRSALILAKTK